MALTEEEEPRKCILDIARAKIRAFVVSLARTVTVGDMVQCEAFRQSSPSRYERGRDRDEVYNTQRSRKIAAIGLLKGEEALRRRPGKRPMIVLKGQQYDVQRGYAESVSLKVRSAD